MNRKKNTNAVAPFIIGIATGLYPVIFYYSNNYTLINSFEHFAKFITFFLIVPSIGFVILQKIILKRSFATWKVHIYAFLNVAAFLLFIQLCLYSSVQWVITIVAFLIAGLVAWFLSAHLKKIVVFQLLLAFIGLFSLVPTLYRQLNYSTEWMKQPDGIEDATFKIKPNIYFIQPDGYASFNMLASPTYNFDNTLFETFLEAKNFKKYPDFRNNYGATLPSNSSLFMMKHHYYNEGSNFSETINARQVIVGDNSVLRILKNNGYSTSFIGQKPYFLINKAKLGYDKVNFSKEEISFITTGLEIRKDVHLDLEKQLDILPNNPQFTFIQIISPGHITSKSYDSKGIEGERLRYLGKLKESNDHLKRMILKIEEQDPNAMIIIMADHGGYVGLESTELTTYKTDNLAIRRSVFGSALAIKWPNSEVPAYDSELKTSVNLFRIITSYLSDNEVYLEQLSNDYSYMVIKEGAPKGIYSYLDGDGNEIFKRHKNGE